MAYRFMLETPEGYSQYANMAVTSSGSAQVVVTRDSLAEGFDRTFTNLTIAAQDLRVIDSLYTWFASLSEPRPPVRLVLHSGDRVLMNDHSHGEMISAIRRDQPWVDRSIPRIGDHAETIVASEWTAAQAATHQATVATVEKPLHRIQFETDGIEYLVVPVTDLAKATRFYEEFFGLLPAERLAAIASGEPWLQDDLVSDRDRITLRNGALTLVLQRLGLGVPIDRSLFGSVPLTATPAVFETLRGWALMRSFPFLSNQPGRFSFSDPFGITWEIGVRVSMLDNYRDLIDELLETPTLVRQRAAESDSSPALISMVAVLRQRDRMVLERIQQMRTRAEPHLRALPDPAIALDNAPLPADSDEAVLAESEISRGDLVSLLMNLTLKEWEKQATHDNGGYVTLSEEVEAHVEFDEEFRRRLGLAEHR